MLGSTCQNISSLLGCVQPKVAPLICHVYPFKRSRHHLKGACQVTISFVAWWVLWKEDSFHSHLCSWHTSAFNTCWLNKNIQSWTAFYSCSLNFIPSCYQLSQALLLFSHFYLCFTFETILTLLSLPFSCNSHSLCRGHWFKIPEEPLLSWPGLFLDSVLAPCWPRIVRTTHLGFTWERGQHFYKVLGLRELSFELHHWRTSNLKTGKSWNPICQNSLWFEADPESPTQEEEIRIKT